MFIDFRQWGGEKDMSPNGHTEDPVDPFHRVWVASKIKQHLCVVKQGVDPSQGQQRA